MKKLPLAICAALAFSAPAFATEQPEGAYLAELSFDSIDLAGRGFVDQGDMENMRQDIFASMDADENSKLTLDE